MLTEYGRTLLLNDDRMVKNALNLAFKWHEGQKRKYSDVPFVIHPIRVALRTARYFDESKYIAVALLHDAVEDNPGKEQEVGEDIKMLVGVDVLDMVKELTNPSKGVKAPRAVRKQMDRDHLAKVNPAVKAIKLIDRIDNLNDMHDAEWDFKQLYAEESKLLFDVLKDSVAEELRWEFEIALTEITGTGFPDQQP